MFYGHSARVRSRQIFWDVLLIAWIVGWSLIGRLVYGIVNTLRAPTEAVANSASSLGDKVNNLESSLPGFVKDRVGNVSAPADSIQDAANNQADSVTHVASLLGWTTALVPIVMAIALAAYFRLRWMKQVRGVTALADDPGWMELLANRAAMHQPLQSIARVSKDPLGDIAAGRYRALARLELEELGIDPNKVELRRANRRATSGRSGH